MKDAYYFSHDSNARNDLRLLKIQSKYGIEGYGIYFQIIEILRETSDYKLKMEDIGTISYDLRIDIKKVEDIIRNYDLFEIEGKFFYSRSLARRMGQMNTLREKRAEAGRKGGQAKPKQRLSKTEAVKEKKEKETKENKIKPNRLLISIDKLYLKELQLKHIDIDVPLQFTKFKDYLLAEGRTYKDYRAGFRNWLTNGYCEKTDKIRLEISREKEETNRKLEHKRVEKDSEGYEEGQAEFNKEIAKLAKRMTV